MAAKSILWENIRDSAELPSATSARHGILSSTTRVPCLALEATTETFFYLRCKLPQGWTGPASLILGYAMASAVSGGIAVGVAVQAVTPGDALDLDTSESYDTENVATDSSLPATAGYMKEITVPLTNFDGGVAGDWVTLRVYRRTLNAGDTATGDWLPIHAELRDSST